MKKNVFYFFNHYSLGNLNQVQIGNAKVILALQKIKYFRRGKCLSLI